MLGMGVVFQMPAITLCPGPDRANYSEVSGSDLEDGADRHIDCRCRPVSHERYSQHAVVFCSADDRSLHRVDICGLDI